MNKTKKNYSMTAIIVLIVALILASNYSKYLEENIDKPFGIYQGMPSEELFISSFNSNGWRSLSEVPQPHPLISHYWVLASDAFGICGVKFITEYPLREPLLEQGMILFPEEFAERLRKRDESFNLILGQLTSKYGEPKVANRSHHFPNQEESSVYEVVSWDGIGNYKGVNSITLERTIRNESGNGLLVIKFTGIYKFENFNKCTNGSSEIL